MLTGVFNFAGEVDLVTHFDISFHFSSSLTFY